MPRTEVPARIIVCYVPTDAADELLGYLSRAAGVISVNLSTGRGASDAGAFGLGKEIAVFTVAAHATAAEEVFGDIFVRGQIDRPGGGIVFMHDARHTTGFKLPDIPPEDV